MEKSLNNDNPPSFLKLYDSSIIFINIFINIFIFEAYEITKNTLRCLNSTRWGSQVRDLSRPLFIVPVNVDISTFTVFSFLMTYCLSHLFYDLSAICPQDFFQLVSVTLEGIVKNVCNVIICIRQ